MINIFAATGNILDNQELIATLESAKAKAVEISEKLQVARATAKEIEEARTRYQAAAQRGAVLFFVLAGLSAVNNMYEYSLASFLTVFNLVSAFEANFSLQGGQTAHNVVLVQWNTGVSSKPSILQTLLCACFLWLLFATTCQRCTLWTGLLYYDGLSRVI